MCQWWRNIQERQHSRPRILAWPLLGLQVVIAVDNNDVLFALVHGWLPGGLQEAGRGRKLIIISPGVSYELGHP